MFRFAVALLVTALQVPNPEEIASVVLLIDQTNEGVIYECNGRRLDGKRILSGVEEELEARHPNASAIELGKKPVFVLVESSLPLDALYEVGVLLEGEAGLGGVRYFVFSRRGNTKTMQEISLNWQRWKLSFDGRLEKNPW